MVQRILLIGSPGAGKSTLTSRLAADLQLPIVRLDRLQWKNDEETVTPEEFQVKLQKELSKERWIMDGNYLQTFPQRKARADLVIWLDTPRWRCLYRVVKRYYRYRGKVNPLGNPDRLDREFLQYIWRFKTEQRPVIQKAYQNQNTLTFVRLKTTKEVAAFVQKIGGEC